MIFMVRYCVSAVRASKMGDRRGVRVYTSTSTAPATPHQVFTAVQGPISSFPDDLCMQTPQKGRPDGLVGAARLGAQGGMEALDILRDRHRRHGPALSVPQLDVALDGSHECDRVGCQHAVGVRALATGALRWPAAMGNGAPRRLQPR